MSETVAMPSAGVRMFKYTFPTEGVLPNSRSLLANPVEVPQLRELTPDGDDFGATDITHLNSPDAHQEKRPGWGKAQTVTGVVLYTETNMAVLQTMKPALAAAGPAAGRSAWAYVFPDGAAFLFIGYIMKIGEQVPGAGTDDPITVPVTWQVSGARKFVDVA